MKTAKPDIYAVDFPIKPGETRFDLTYTVAVHAPAKPYAGKVVTKDENTYLIAPNGVTLTGDGLNDLGAEPRTQAHIYGLQGDSYKITAHRRRSRAAGRARRRRAESESSGPQIEQIMPRVNDQSQADPRRWRSASWRSASRCSTARQPEGVE